VACSNSAAQLFYYYFLAVLLFVPSGGMLKLCRTDFPRPMNLMPTLCITNLFTPKLCSAEIGCRVGAMWLQVCFAAIWLFAAVRQKKGH
jgi:hypothetical protein